MADVKRYKYQALVTLYAGSDRRPDARLGPVSSSGIPGLSFSCYDIAVSRRGGWPWVSHEVNDEHSAASARRWASQTRA